MTLGFSFLLLSFTFRWLLFFFPSRALILYIHLVFSSGGLIFQILFSFHMVWVHLKFLLVRIFLTDRYICGHATLAAAHTVFSNGLIGSSDTVEFSTHSGILTAKRVDDCEAKGSFFIELNFRVITTCEYSSSDLSMLAKALNGATIVDVWGTATDKLVSKPLKGSTKPTTTDRIMVTCAFHTISYIKFQVFLIPSGYRLCFHLGNLSLSYNQKLMTSWNVLPKWLLLPLLLLK